MLRRYLRRLSESRFWLSRWLVSLTLLVAVLVGALVFVAAKADFDTVLNYVALALLIFVVITLFYGIIAIHDVPYEIAKHRDHPHQDAIHAAGWVSLFTLHVIWPFLWIWAMIYRPDRGWGFESKSTNDLGAQREGFDQLRRRVEELEKRSESRVH